MDLKAEQLLDRLKKHSRLGHAKKNRAFFRQVALACSSPGLSMAQSAGKGSSDSNADLMSLYRFLGNKTDSVNELRKIRTQVVLESFDNPEDPILVAHDVTQLDFTRHNSKSDRKLIGDHKGKGYEYVTCVALDPKQEGRIAGVLHDTVVSEKGPDDDEIMDYDYEPIFDGFTAKEKERLRKNHRHQMAVHINGFSELLGNRKVIHVADCEFDDLFILERCIKKQTDFVIRTTAHRNVEIPQTNWIPETAKTRKQAGHPSKPGWQCVNLPLLINAVPLRPYKTIWLDAKEHLVQPEHGKRQVDLLIGALPVRLYRYAKRNKKYVSTPCAVEMNLIVVREINSSPGQTPLCWTLFTSLPIDSAAEQAYVADLYRFRWKIEEFFRLIKSGYLIERSRLDDATKIAKQLVIITLAAMVITNLKAALNLNLKGPLSKEDYFRIKNAQRNLKDSCIDLNLRLFCLLLKLGGWIGRRADPIGPAVLMRGIQQLFGAFEVYSQYPEILKYGIEHPKEIEDFLGFKL